MKTWSLISNNWGDLQKIREEAQKNRDKALKEACTEFEALFLYQILKGLEKTVPEDGLFKKTLQEKIYKDLFYQEITHKLAQRGTGLAKLLYKQLSTHYGGKK